MQHKSDEQSHQVGTPSIEVTAGKLDRRTAMTAMTAIVAAPAAAMIPARAHARANADRRAWDAALTRFRAVNAAYDAAIDRHTAAENAADLMCPRVDKFFRRNGGYDLGMGMTRERVLRQLSWTAKDGENQEAIADEFMAYQERCRQAAVACGEVETEAAVEALREPYWAARDALIAATAPDLDALAVKLELVHLWHDSDFTEAALADARRLAVRSSR